MSNLLQASRQWASRPSDERYLNLNDMLTDASDNRRLSASRVLANRDLRAIPASDTDGDVRGSILIEGPNGTPVAPTHWAFGQIAQRAGVPVGILRDMPAELGADVINWGLHVNRDVEEVGVMLRRTTQQGEGHNTLAAVTGPGYGRIWNETILAGLVRQFGDGRTGRFRVPGEFGRQVEVTKANTTLYASDRDFFVFLADEENRIEFPGQRRARAWNGTDIAAGMARGFFCWNSEVGAQTFGVAAFLFDYACSNRIVWGARDYREIRIRHTSGAPHRFLEEAAPMLRKMADASTGEYQRVLTDAQVHKIGDADKVREFLAKRFTKGQVAAIQASHIAEEDRPIETLWDAVAGVTAYAKGVAYQDERVALEREAGKILDLAA